MEWLDKKEELEKLILEDKLSYRDIGKIYGVTDSMIRKTAKRLGIELPKRREINPNETFNKGKGEKIKCLKCGREFPAYTKSVKFCSRKCAAEYRRDESIKKWKNGEYTPIGECSKFTIPDFIRYYMLEKVGYKCEVCGFNEVNPFTGKPILQIHHIDGNSENNNEENLQVLCPNHHAMTDNFGSRNKNASPGRSRYFGRSN